MARVLHRGILH